MSEIQQAMAILAFPMNTTCNRYKKLFDMGRWSDLIIDFKNDNYQLYSLPADPMLMLTLQAGLASVKTPACNTDHKSPNCPVCSPPFSHMAEKLPTALYMRSCLVCRISGELMDADNPPLVMPNGMVYSKKALTEMAAANGGFVKCPKTGTTYRYEELRKAFIS